MERDDTDTEDNSAGNTDANDAQGIVGKKLALLKHVEELIYGLTLFMNPFPRVVTLNAWVVEVWEEAQKVLGDTEQSEKSRGLVNHPKSTLRESLRLIIFHLAAAISFANSFALCLGY